MAQQRLLLKSLLRTEMKSREFTNCQKLSALNSSTCFSSICRDVLQSHGRGLITISTSSSHLDSTQLRKSKKSYQNQLQVKALIQTVKLARSECTSTTAKISLREYWISFWETKAQLNSLEKSEFKWAAASILPTSLA